MIIKQASWTCPGFSNFLRDDTGQLDFGQILTRFFEDAKRQYPTKDMQNGNSEWRLQFEFRFQTTTTEET